MKLFTTLCIITFIIIDGVQNAPGIKPRPIHTITMHPITVNPTSGRVPTITPSQSSERYSTDVTRFTEPTSSPSSTTTDSPWGDDSDYVLQFAVRVFLYLFVVGLVWKILGSVCKSKKPVKPLVRIIPVTVDNKMNISTINGQREEPPPTYVEIHKV